MAQIKRYRLAQMMLILFLLPPLCFGEVYITKEEVIRNIFPSHKEYKEEAKIVDSQEVKVYTALANGKIIGWAVVLDEMGKIKPITFLVGIDAEDRVLQVYVLEYRDMFGSEIKRRSFLKQFRSKSTLDILKIGRDIDAVTGATISSNAAASAVKKALKIIEDARKE